MPVPTLDTIPPEILEHIAFLAGTDPFLGPPSSLFNLVCTNRRIHTHLSSISNPHLYARVFLAKFDHGHVFRRLCPEDKRSFVLSSELQQRCVNLKRIRALTECPHPIPGMVLWTAYLMMLENGGKNKRQLEEYAGINHWLKDYLFGDRGSVYSAMQISTKWPSNTEEISLAMWLLWFFMKPDHYIELGLILPLKAFALGARHYALSTLSWAEFHPTGVPLTQMITYYSSDHLVTYPSLAPPAILCFLSLQAQHQASYSFTDFNATSDGVTEPSPSGREYEIEWERCTRLASDVPPSIVAGVFRPGSAVGSWEGLFTFTDFEDYAGLLSGAPPKDVFRFEVLQQRQTWKLREYHLLEADLDLRGNCLPLPAHSTRPVPALRDGDPLFAFFPSGTHMREDGNILWVQEPGRHDELRYVRGGRDALQRNDTTPLRILDIIILGEGHASWGTFRLIGRVRPCDGLVVLCKDYITNNRGRWLYRGYLVGGGNFVGRWRDSVSAADTHGYEGCFWMRRRQ